MTDELELPEGYVEITAMDDTERSFLGPDGETYSLDEVEAIRIGQEHAAEVGPFGPADGGFAVFDSLDRVVGNLDAAIALLDDNRPDSAERVLRSLRASLSPGWETK